MNGMPVPKPRGLLVGAVCGAVLAVVLAAPAPATEAPQVEESFDGAGWHDDWASWYPGPHNQAGSGSGIDGHGLSVTIPAGSHYGTRFSYPFPADDGPESLYFRYFLRFDDNFGREGNGKLPGPVGIYNNTALGGKPSTPERPGWSARMQFAPGPTDGTTLLGYYTYHLDQPGLFGEGMSWGPTGVLTNGEWYCVEGYVGLNTPGQSDGVLRGWINEVPAMERSDLMFRRAGEGNIDISSFWFNVYFGGKRTAGEGKQISFDQVALGPERIGCGGVAPVVLADVDGDGRDDAVELVSCSTGSCWTIEPGGPVTFDQPVLFPAAPQTSTETLLRGMVSGRFDGDQRDDIAYIGRCADGSRCWIVHASTGSAPGDAREWGVPVNGAPHDPLLSGDVDGDGLDDIVMRGSCESNDCWLVHYSTGEMFSTVHNAGDGAYFSSVTAEHGLSVADVTGDGRDDLVYRGLCGDQRPCWRVQASAGTTFLPGVSWGNTTGFASTDTLADFETGDLNGDGRSDILYRGVCGDSECWRVLLAIGDRFEPRYWGSEASLEHLASSGGFRTADVDANGVADLVYRTGCPAGLCWSVHLSTGTGFVSVGSDPIIDVVDPRPILRGPDQTTGSEPVLS